MAFGDAVSFIDKIEVSVDLNNVNGSRTGAVAFKGGNAGNID